MDIATIVNRLVILLGKPAFKQISRSERFIDLCNKLEIKITDPPQDFQFIYSCALVDYAMNSQSSAVVFLKVLREDKIIEAFQRSFQDQRSDILLLEVKKLGEWNYLGDQIKEASVDVEKELEIFSTSFQEMLQKYRSPNDIMIMQATERKERVPREWNSFLENYGYWDSELVRFETVTPTSMRFAVIDEDDVIKIKLGERFRLIYNLPKQSYLMLLQGCSSEWVITRFLSYKGVDLELQDKRSKEKLIKAGPGEFVCPPRNQKGLAEKHTCGEHVFVLFCSLSPFPDKITDLVRQEAEILTSGSLEKILNFARINIKSIQCIVAKCDIVPF